MSSRQLFYEWLDSVTIEEWTDEMLKKELEGIDWSRDFELQIDSLDSEMANVFQLLENIEYDEIKTKLTDNSERLYKLVINKEPTCWMTIKALEKFVGIKVTANELNEIIESHNKEDLDVTKVEKHPIEEEYYSLIPEQGLPPLTEINKRWESFYLNEETKKEMKAKQEKRIENKIKRVQELEKELGVNNYLILFNSVIYIGIIEAVKIIFLKTNKEKLFSYDEAEKVLDKIICRLEKKVNSKKRASKLSYKFKYDPTMANVAIKEFKKAIDKLKECNKEQEMKETNQLKYITESETTILDKLFTELDTTYCWSIQLFSDFSGVVRDEKDNEVFRFNTLKEALTNVRIKLKESQKPTPVFTNSKGDEFFEGDSAYYAMCEDLEIYHVKKLKQPQNWDDGIDSSLIFKTEAEAKEALIKKLGEKVKEGDKCMFYSKGDHAMDIRNWSVLREADLSRMYGYLDVLCFAKLVENGIIE